VISARGVSFSFGAREVLRDVDLQVRAGELVVVGGANGAGKSTLLRLVAGELAPAAGEVRVDGRAPADWPPRELARRLAVVPQQDTMRFPFTAGEVVLMGRAPHTGRFSLEGPEDVARAREAMGELDLLPLADRGIDELSGGERRRVALARALAQEPGALLLDEPVAFLDIRHRVGLFRTLDRLRRERGLAVLMTSHDLGLAAQHATRMLLLHEGAVLASGEPATVLRPDLLQRSFGVPVEVAEHPRTGRPYLLFGGGDGADDVSGENTGS
jgi:iron complex transport system ATP-binding protein